LCLGGAGVAIRILPRGGNVKELHGCPTVITGHASRSGPEIKNERSNAKDVGRKNSKRRGGAIKKDRKKAKQRHRKIVLLTSSRWRGQRKKTKN